MDHDEDYFETHFADVDTHDLHRGFEAVKKQEWKITYENSEVLGRVTTAIPKTIATQFEPEPWTKEPVTSIEHLGLKKRLLERCLKIIPQLSPMQAALAPVVFKYQDLLYGGRTPKNAESLRHLTALHALNHLSKTRDRVIRNNEKLQLAAKQNNGAEVPEVRDQGFTRPKVLILLETRSACVKWVDSIVAVSAPDQQENKKRFEDAFVSEEEKYGDEKPEDFLELFEGNDDNDFRLGLKFTRKTLKLYSQFYSSDIILASPLGLRRAIKADE